MKSEEKREAMVMAIAQASMDINAYSVALEIKRLIAPMIDEGTPVDSGTGFGEADLRCSIGGQYYAIIVKPVETTPSPA